MLLCNLILNIRDLKFIGLLFQLFVKINSKHLTLFGLPICRMGTVRLHATVDIHYHKWFYNGFLVQIRFLSHSSGVVSDLQ